MQTTPAALISQNRANGFWGDTRITDLFDIAVEKHPQRIALVDPPNRTALVGGTPLRLSFQALATRVQGYALRLRELGLGRNDILITQLPNIAEYPAIYLAAARLGIILSPVPMQFQNQELQQIIKITSARALLTVAKFKDALPYSLLLDSSVLGSTKQLILCEAEVGNDYSGNENGPMSVFPAKATSTNVTELTHYLNEHSPSADDVMTICWTSGTEGTPKGVPRTHNHWHAISHAHFEGAGLREGDVLLNPFPLINMAAIGGCFMSWLHARGTLVLHHPLELSVYLTQIATEKPNYAIAPPAVLNMLLKDDRLLTGVDLSSLRCIGSGSAPLEPAMIQGYADRFNIEIVNMFGSNEGMSLVSGKREAPDSAQRARFFPRFGRNEVFWPHRSAKLIETRIVNVNTGREILAAGEAGEMQIRGPTVFDGYFAAPEITRQSFTDDGFFRTGDLFEISGTDSVPRYYRFVGRLKQVIIRGGVKISPEELDDVLCSHPEILEGCIVGVSDEILGERIGAVVVLRAGKKLELSILKKFFSDAGLAIFKSPERLLITENLPRNALGKIVRSEVVKIINNQKF
ncbi:MAG: (2,3-dihydroxybenzoyl)adenylate synthase [Gammaproteobacteria bacterium]|nr:(2,3-dihydroxybenzoyl)adenylate synthase [Gammaproteobacteria bacterium]